MTSSAPDVRYHKDLNILFVCSGNNRFMPSFIVEQKKELEKKGIRVDVFKIKGKGVFGYLKNYSALLNKIKSNSYQLVHGHYGLSGLLACLQRKLPVIISFYGSDLNNKKYRIFSQIANKLAKKVIVVSENLKVLLKDSSKCEVIPCGVNTTVFVPIDKEEARKNLELSNRYKFDEDKKYILFSSRFDRDVKNPKLAMNSIKHLGEEYELIEFKNFKNKEVVLFFNAADALLMTSKTEGSPQVIKEAMACNRPIVTTKVGDVEEVINGTKGCFITEPTVAEVANNIAKAIQFKNTSGRETIGTTYDTEVTIKKVINMYKSILNN